MWPCLGVVWLRTRTTGGARTKAEAFVVAKKLFGYSCIIELEGVTVHTDRLVMFGVEKSMRH